jgi:hypothetical protein
MLGSRSHDGRSDIGRIRDPDQGLSSLELFIEVGPAHGPSDGVAQIGDGFVGIDALLRDHRRHAVGPHHDQGGAAGAPSRLEGGGDGDATVEHDHGGARAPKDANELLVVRGESDDVEPFGFEDETQEPVRPLGLTQDDLHPWLIHLP